MSIGQRIATLVVLSVGVCLTIFGIYNAHVRTAELLGDAVQDAAEVGSTLDVVLNVVLQHHELRELASMPDEISRSERIYGLAVFDLSNGEVITSRLVESHRPELRALAQRAVATRRSISRRLTFEGTETASYAFPLRRGDSGVVGAAVLVRDLASESRLLRASSRRLMGTGIILVIVTLAVVLAVARQTITQPVAALISGVQRIGTGNLTVPIGLSTQDEMGRIAQAIDQLMLDLGNAREAQRRELEARIELEKSVGLERRMQHAQRLAAVGQIAASLAHEIGSPLHVIAGRARYASELGSPQELKDNLLVIAEQADRITRVVQQLLSVARRRAPRLESVSLADTVRAVVDLLGPQARGQKIELTMKVPENIPAVHGDPDALQQVIFNLALNAIQAQSDGGRVSIELKRIQDKDSLGSARESVAVDVSDRGPGVPASMREEIFEPFATSKEGRGGTGLGLAVVRGIVREHRGTIRVLENEGGGALFRVTLPLSDDD